MKLLSHYPSCRRSRGNLVKFPLAGKGEICTHLQKGEKGKLGNCRVLSLTPVTCKVMGQILLGTLLGRVTSTEEAAGGQRGVAKGNRASHFW